MIEKLWIYPSNGMYDRRFECDWARYSNQSNCQYLKELATLLRKDNFDANVVSISLIWLYLFGSLHCINNF